VLAVLETVVLVVEVLVDLELPQELLEEAHLPKENCHYL
jgi:hypothetical protein